MSKTTKTKKPKLPKISTIHNRLYKLASLKCRKLANDRCAVCGRKVGDIGENGNPIKIEAHHIMSRENKNSPLKWDLQNLVALCSLHHKFGRFSAHKHGLWFANWFKEKYPDRYQWILDHTNDEVNLNDREYLAKVEESLK